VAFLSLPPRTGLMSSTTTNVYSDSPASQADSGRAAGLTWLAQPICSGAVKKRRPLAADRSPLATRNWTLWSVFVVVGVFVLTRIGYYVAGVRFDASSLPWFWQFIDPALLKTNLGQSLWYLHSQPPTFNLFLGLVLNLFPGHETLAFTTCYLLLGIAFTVAMFLLLRELGVPDTPSAVLTAVYIASPTCVLYENWLFYTYPLTLLLLLTALFWQRFVRRGRFVDALLVFACAAVLTMTWSLFHLVWLLGLVLALVLLRRRDWRKVLAAAAVPLLIVTLWYGKNLVQFGQFTGSTWFGINFSKMTNSMLTVPERRALYDNGTISSVSMVPPFSNPDKYYSALPKPTPTGIPILDQELKPSTIPNFNNVLFIAVSRQYGRDARRILAAHPTAYLRGLAESYLLYFLPASAYLFVAGNAEHISGLERFASIAFDGRFSYHLDHGLRSTQPARYYLQGLLNTGWFLILAYVFVLIFGLVLLFRHSGSSFFFVWFNVAWVTLVANAVEVGENNRFRFMTDPLVFVFVASLGSAWLAGRRKRINDRPPKPERKWQ